MNDELINKIHLKIDEETKDHEEYLEMAAMLKEHGCEEAAGVIEDIAHDEETHIKFLHYILNK